MAIYIKIKKISNKEDNKKIYYEVSTQDFGGSIFYFCIDQESKQIFFSIANDFSKVIKTINLLHLEEPIGSLDNVDQRIYTRVVMKAIKAFQESNFSEFLDYCA